VEYIINIVTSYVANKQWDFAHAENRTKSQRIKGYL